jgi:uncharacterized protein (DUF927 family)
MLLSSGEISLADHIACSGRRAKAGQTVRLVDIDADGDAGMGVFENLHGAPSPDELSRHLTRCAGAIYGTPIRAFLTHVAEHRQDVVEFIIRYREELLQIWVSSAMSGELTRIAGRFAFVAAAGEAAARSARVLTWPPSACTESIARCFRRFVSAHDPKGNFDTESGIRRVRQFLEMHGSSRFQATEGTLGDRIVNRAGFKRVADDGEFEYLCLPETFTNEICAGHDARAVAKAMAQHGFLVTDDPHLTVKRTLPEIGRTRVYVIKASIFDVSV